MAADQQGLTNNYSCRGTNQQRSMSESGLITRWYGTNTGQPEISVLIPVWHGEKTIGGALDSIENQERVADQFSIQIVVVADGRNEDGLAISSWVEKRKADLRCSLVLLQLCKNIGVGAARKAGYSYCTGKFLAFLDDDDVWHPEKIAKQWNWHQANPNQVISAHGYGEVKEEANVRFLDLILGMTPLPTPTLMINKLLWSHKPESCRFGEDWLMLAMAASSQPIKLLPWNLAKRNPEAPGLLNDRYSLSRQRLRLRVAKIISILRLVKRGKLNPILIPALILLNIMLLVRRFILDRLEILG